MTFDKRKHVVMGKFYLTNGVEIEEVMCRGTYNMCAEWLESYTDCMVDYHSLWITESEEYYPNDYT